MKQLIPFALCAACAATQPVPPALEDTCGAVDNAALIGQDATALEKVLIIGMVRVIRPGDMVTQDYRPTRINFMIGADEKITSITCG
ncbi:I78 family peptidase inhibitor [Yoonia sp.]|uniref:I78 family peptidase inhibitor n=1 Tax=Yoonia sp. TaxID=2212373 RepID=UPI003F6CEEA9